MFSIKDGSVWGGDIGGITYEGSVRWPGPGSPVDASLSMTIPAGLSMVQGTAPQDISQRREFDTQLPEDFAEGNPFQLMIPPGPVWIAARRIPEEGVDVDRLPEIGVRFADLVRRALADHALAPGKQ